MIIVVDNFFDDRIFNAVYDEISRLEFNDVKVGADNDGSWTAEEGIEYPGIRSQVFYKHKPLLDEAIIRQLDSTPTPFTAKAYNYYQYAHLRLEKDNAGEYIHQDLDDWAYLIYLSETNLDSGTKMYESVKSVPTVRMSSFSEKDKEKDKEHTLVRFVQNRIVMFDSLIPHMAWNNHGNDMSDGRLTINGFCLYDYS